MSAPDETNPLAEARQDVISMFFKLIDEEGLEVTSPDQQALDDVIDNVLSSYISHFSSRAEASALVMEVWGKIVKWMEGDY